MPLSIYFGGPFILFHSCLPYPLFQHPPPLLRIPLHDFITSLGWPTRVSGQRRRRDQVVRLGGPLHGLCAERPQCKLEGTGCDKRESARSRTWGKSRPSLTCCCNSRTLFESRSHSSTRRQYYYKSNISPPPFWAACSRFLFPPHRVPFCFGPPPQRAQSISQSQRRLDFAPTIWRPYLCRVLWLLRIPL